MLQEVWTPKEEIRLKDFQSPILKLRSENAYGGVAILAHKNVKFVRCPQFEDPNLEAIWADVKVGKVRTVVGSVYVNVGILEQLTFLDKVIEFFFKNQ